MAAPAPEKAKRARRDATINLRLSTAVRSLIDTAAEMSGKTRTEFVVESARQHAVDVLMDQRLFALGPDRWDAFLSALDDPPPPNDRLKRLMAKTPPWDR